MVAAPPPVPLAVAFRDPAHGVLGTSRTIELTADGGKTWKVVLHTPRPVVSVSFFDGAEGGRAWALCVTQAGAGSEGKSVYRLDARGWKRVAYTPFAPPGPGGYGGISLYGYPEGIAMAADGFGVIWESRGTLYVTSDGGSHWTGLPKVVRPEEDFGQSGAALPHGIGYVLFSIGGSGVRRLIGTRDRGRTWHLVHRWP